MYVPDYFTIKDSLIIIIKLWSFYNILLPNNYWLPIKSETVKKDT